MPAHLSLHYDGLMATAGDTGVVSDTLEQAEKKVLAPLGLQVTLVQKSHVWFLDALRKAGAEKAGAAQPQDLDA